ncbi:MAG: PEP-CTERM sorting domain-containing protein [Burkholderiales bacterium]|uniref:EDSAP-1 family PEP-CTERM protein n=1 Tax=Roseateles sp. TaxID=1971397 RepID=UPI000FA09CF4|nr:MAG: PEP-CTERM sorting domain-containing protein [Burkholderiales bacterium]
MTKSYKLKAVAAVAGVFAALVASAPANAYVYSVSKLEIKDLDVSVFAAGTKVDISAASNYQFNLTNTAKFQPTGGSTWIDAQASGCKGNVLPSAGPVYTTCNTASPVLDALVANAPGLTAARADNNFGVLGADPVKSYSNADSQVKTAKLVQGGKTNTVQIAESLLNTNGSATANTEVKSTTTLVTNLVIQGGVKADVDISFASLLTLNGAIADLFNGLYTSSAGSNVTFSLSKNGTNQSWTWSPDGSGTSQACQFSGGGIAGSSCSVIANEGNLNVTDSRSSNPDSFSQNFGSFKNFGLLISNLSSGLYSLSLQATTTTSVDRLAIPEPGSVALVGLALGGLGFASKRRSRKQ